MSGTVCPFVDRGFQLGEWFEIVADRDGSGDPVREPVRCAAVSQADREAFGFDKRKDFLDETFGCGTSEELWCDRVDFGTGGLVLGEDGSDRESNDAVLVITGGLVGFLLRDRDDDLDPVLLCG